jgi:hypothetical protein
MDQGQPTVQPPGGYQGAPPLPVAPRLPPGSTSRGQGVAVIILLCALLAIGCTLIALAATGRSNPAYEYKQVAFFADGSDRTGTGALEYASVDADVSQLNQLGAEGWEIVGSYLEMETAYPNFGDTDYVTGIQPNVRPQRLVILLEREVR